eukprot:5381539-Prymnesium_polylepis.1
MEQPWVSSGSLEGGVGSRRGAAQRICSNLNKFASQCGFARSDGGEEPAEMSRAPHWSERTPWASCEANGSICTGS